MNKQNRPIYLTIFASEPRITRDEAFMAFAQIISARSTCRRLHVGAIVTNAAGTQVLGIGYNGNARGFPNDCDTVEPGECGCIHAETNALIKASPEPGKCLYITHAPCVRCSKLNCEREH